MPLVPRFWGHLGHISPETGLSAWDFDPVLVGSITLTIGLYLYAVGPYRARRHLGPPPKKYRSASFLAGMLVVWFALASPIDSIGEHYLFSVHMVQHLILLLVACPLLVVGVPQWTIRLLPYSSAVHSLTKTLTMPLVTFVLSSGVFLAWHIPPFYEAALQNSVIHKLEHASILAAGTLMWWPTLSPVRALPALSVPGQLLYYFVLPVPTSIVGALITFGSDPLYVSYAEAPRLWGLSVSTDQEIAGLLMWVPGKLVFWAAMGLAFFRWFRDENATDSRASNLYR